MENGIKPALIQLHDFMYRGSESYTKFKNCGGKKTKEVRGGYIGPVC